MGSWFPQPKAYQGGGLATDVTGALWATDQISDKVLLVDVEDDLVTDLPWLSLSTTAGTLALVVLVATAASDIGRGGNIWTGRGGVAAEGAAG